MKAQLLFYPVTEQLFVFNDSQVRCSSFLLEDECEQFFVVTDLLHAAFLLEKKIKKDIDICSNQYYIYIIN